MTARTDQRQLIRSRPTHAVLSPSASPFLGGAPRWVTVHLQRGSSRMLYPIAHHDLPTRACRPESCLRPRLTFVYLRPSSAASLRGTSGFVLLKAIPGLARRQDVTRVRRVVLEFASQLGDVGVHGPRQDRRVVATDFSEKIES